ncbi:MAG: hypothetical protein KC729_02055 [Candidatus Eisenbacteria bacterium]|uniref:Uncharacterized protein n=1 Tax=Eiseniibacteriota bacterium TaxID=2212470 RepID=A0A956LVE0_UNCEI|nr:hypothetical protein [Candidatus Eisenbacteria bacterium]
MYTTDLEARIAGLEKSLRRQRTIGAAVLSVTALLILMGQSPSPKAEPVLRAERFVLVDQNGSQMAELSVDRGSGKLVLLDRRGFQTVVGGAGPGIEISSRDGNGVEARFALLPYDENPFCQLMLANGKAGFSIAALNDVPVVQVTDADGRLSTRNADELMARSTSEGERSVR